MLFDLPSDDVLYDALVARDASYEGRAFVGVTSTGIFCRLTCPARKPLRKNCTFHGTVGACFEAGFRPCKRCKPLGEDPLLEALMADPTRRWREADLVALGHDPSALRKSFRRRYGITFLEMSRLLRLGHAFTSLSKGASVIDAQLDAGFDSASGFRSAFAGLMGRAPGQMGKDTLLKASWINSPLGPLVAVCDDTHLHLLEFADRKALPKELAKLEASTKIQISFGATAVTAAAEAALDAYFSGKSPNFSVPLKLHGSPFTRDVWTALQRIPAGQTRTYGALAHDLGRPTASRAVARANGANQIAIIVPCHRVIGADGSLTGYGGGLWRKERLIEIERQYL